jgi:hypothetical protein
MGWVTLTDSVEAIFVKLVTGLLGVTVKAFGFWCKNECAMDANTMQTAESSRIEMVKRVVPRVKGTTRFSGSLIVWQGLL